jgi:hypothetical protein
MSLPLHRRRLPAVTAALLLSAALSACGFDYSTDSIYVSSAGVDDRTGPLDVLSAVVVAAEPDRGTFIASFSNNSPDSPERIQDVRPGSADPSLTISGFKPVTLPPGGLISLAADPSATLTGTFTPGEYVDIVIEARNAEDIEMSVPVVAATDQYAGLDISGQSVISDPPEAFPEKKPSPRRKNTE